MGDRGRSPERGGPPENERERDRGDGGGYGAPGGGGGGGGYGGGGGGGPEPGEPGKLYIGNISYDVRPPPLPRTPPAALARSSLHPEPLPRQ